MRSIKELVQQEGLGSFPVSLKELGKQHGVNSLKALVASLDIQHFYRLTNKQWGPLGDLSDTIVQLQPDGTYIKNFRLGGVTKKDNSIKGITRYGAAITLAGVKCFGTDDPGGTDEFYAIVTAMSINADGNGEPEVVTKRFNIVDVQAGQNVYVNLDVGKIGITGSGIRIHVALWDHEYGDPEEVRQRVYGYFLEAGKLAATSIYGAAGWAIVEGILDSKIGKAIFGGITDWFADLFDEDFIGEQTYTITEGDIYKLAEQDAEGGFPNFVPSLMTSPALPPDVQYNFPIGGDSNPYWLIDKGDGSYKVYFRVTPFLYERPVTG